MQQIIQHWWKHERHNYRLAISTLVREEISRGDPIASAKRLQAIQGIEVLEINREIRNLADMLVKKNMLPSKSKDDAIHIAATSFYGIDCLLTYNCKHISNINTIPQIQDTIKSAGYRCPIITLPQNLISISKDFYEKPKT
jgi:hypothetical protein